jgi:hypothetical protein
MALRRHRRSSDSTSFRTSVERDVAAKIERARQRRTAERKAARERIPADMVHRATKKERAELKAHGFRVTPKGVVVDRPRDKKRKRIPGARISILKGGIVKMTVKQRRDFIVGFTERERSQFALNPDAKSKEVIAALKKSHPSLRKGKMQVRLQWGSYQATKDFSPTFFTRKYFTSISPEDIRKYGKRRAPIRADKLTGLHIVIHVPKSSTADKQKRNRKRATRRKRK